MRLVQDEELPEDLSDNGEDLSGTLSVGLDDQCFSETEMLYCTMMGTVKSSCVLIGLSRALGALNFLARIKAWVSERAYNGEYTDILIMMTRK